MMTTSNDEDLQDKITAPEHDAARENLHEDRDILLDGNCMFHALSLQLLRVEINLSHIELRRLIVHFLRINPVFDSVDSRNFIVDSDWYDYLDRMERNGECGDHIILNAAARIFNIQICILSISSTNEPISINPLNVEPDQTLYLGHISETHYLSLVPNQEKPKEQHKEQPLVSSLEEISYPDDDIEISNVTPDQGLNDSTDMLSEDNVPLLNTFDQHFSRINSCLQYTLLGQSFDNGNRLSRDDRTLVFQNLLELHSNNLPFEIEIANDFIQVYYPSSLDILSYNGFKLISRGLYLVYLTYDVHRWLSLNNYPALVYCYCIIVLNEESNDDLVQYLQGI